MVLENRRLCFLFFFVVIGALCLAACTPSSGNNNNKNTDVPQGNETEPDFTDATNRFREISFSEAKGITIKEFLLPEKYYLRTKEEMPVYKIGEVEIGVVEHSVYGDNLYYGVYYMNEQALRPDIVEVYQYNMTGGNLERIAVYDEKDGKRMWLNNIKAGKDYLFWVLDYHDSNDEHITDICKMKLEKNSIEVIKTFKDTLQGDIGLSLTEPYLTWYEKDINANGENGDTEALNLMLKSSLSNTYCNRTT